MRRDIRWPDGSTTRYEGPAPGPPDAAVGSYSAGGVEHVVYVRMIDGHRCISGPTWLCWHPITDLQQQGDAVCVTVRTGEQFVYRALQPALLDLHAHR